MLTIAQSVFDRLRLHGESAYPEESCGVLLGTLSPETRLVLEAAPLENKADNRRGRYEIAPLDLVRMEKRARQAGRQILGFYHSHPDHPAEPSLTDLEEAHWLGCSYLITRVAHARAQQTQSFLLGGATEEDKHFLAETLRIVDSPALAQSTINPA